MRRLAVGSVAAALIVLVVAGCGGSEASPSASAGTTASAAPAATNAPAATDAPAVTDQPTEAPATPGTVTMTAICAAVGVRQEPSTDGKLVVRASKGTKVRVVETVTGDPYTAGGCGASGDDWLKIDRINGKSVQTLYGVPFGYAAGGFFQ